MDITQQLFASRATEKSSAALYILATSGGSLADRLTRAWLQDFAMLSGRSLPGEFQERFNHMYEMVTTGGVTENAGQVENSIRAMSTQDAQKLANLMVSFAVDVTVATS